MEAASWGRESRACTRRRMSSINSRREALAVSRIGLRASIKVDFNWPVLESSWVERFVTMSMIS